MGRQLQFVWKCKDIFKQFVQKGKKGMMLEDIRNLWHFRDREGQEVLLQFQDDMRKYHETPEEAIMYFFPDAHHLLTWKDFAAKARANEMNDEQARSIFRELSDGDTTVTESKFDLCLLIEE